jgi:hypothetical protein
MYLILPNLEPFQMTCSVFVFQPLENGFRLQFDMLMLSSSADLLMITLLFLRLFCIVCGPATPRQVFPKHNLWVSLEHIYMFMVFDPLQMKQVGSASR